MSQINSFSENEWTELLQCFLDESIEHLEGIEPLLLQLESAPPENCEQLTNKVFRAAHSIKGSSGMFGFSNIHNLSHKTEWLLEKLRSGKTSITPELIDVLLKSFDQLRNLVENAQESNAIDISEILAELEKQLGDDTTKSKRQEAKNNSADNAACSKGWPVAEINATRELGFNVYIVNLDLIKDIDNEQKPLAEFLKMMNGLGTILHLKIDFDAFIESLSANESFLPTEIIYSSEIDSEQIEMFIEVPEGACRLITSPLSVKPEPVSQQQEKPPASNNQAKIKENIQVQENVEPTLRVKVKLLENLMNLAGELVLSRNQLRESLNSNDMRAIRISGQRISQVTTELQETIMLTRLQPIDRVFSKFPRLIRDFSKKLKKEINLTIEGKEVELDKTLIEGLGDPLTHMVRNAIDHGVETPEDRKKANKSSPAQIRIQAFYEASRVIIEVTDDGKGIDGEKVCHKALERGLISAEKARHMSDKEMQNLIFLPGLSTAESVSELSGRGVGMDVVKANIDRLGGSVEIISEVGKGSSFKIKLPLTLAIIPSLILRSSAEMFAIPQANVLEMLLIPAEMIKRRVEIIGNQEVLILRGKLLPLLSLNRFLGSEKTYENPKTGEICKERRQRLADRRESELRKSQTGIIPHDTKHKESRNDGRRFHSASGINVIVVTTGSFTYALIVDKPLFTEEIVVKQLGYDLKLLNEYSGATILGDGRIALIIDVMGLASRAEILGQRAALHSRIAGHEKAAGSETQALPFLSFKLAGPENYALPLFLVSRLEKILPGQFIVCGDWRAIQLEDKILPVLSVSGKHHDSLPDDHEWGVIVVRIRNREVGLIAALPIQVIEITPEFDRTVFSRPGISGATLWNNQSLLFIDILELLLRERPELLKPPEEREFNNEISLHVAVAEPNNYFQNQLKLQLENEGCQVKITGSIAELEDCLSDRQFSFHGILADLNLLKQDRFNFLQRFKQNASNDDIKVAGLWLNQTDCDLETKQNGVDLLMQKLEMEQMSDWISHLKSKYETPGRTPS